LVDKDFVKQKALATAMVMNPQATILETNGTEILEHETKRLLVDGRNDRNQLGLNVRIQISSMNTLLNYLH
jgi:hypothetical protein